MKHDRIVITGLELCYPTSNPYDDVMTQKLCITGICEAGGREIPFTKDQ